MTSTRKRYHYVTQKQPLSGIKGTEFLKTTEEQESIGPSTDFEQLLIAAMVIHFILHGIEVNAENVCKAYSDVNQLAGLFPFVELPILKRTIQFFRKYLKRIMDLFTQFGFLSGPM